MSGARQWWHRPAVQMLVVLVAVSAAALAATTLSADRDVPAAVSPTVAPVTETTVACPGLRSRKGFTESAVAAATPPQVPGVDQDASGSGQVRTLSPRLSRERTLINLTEPGDRGIYVGRNGERDSVTGSATGSLAPGFSVTQTERTVDGSGRGLASTQCQPTGTDFWFVGAASGVGERAVLVLTNPEAATATVDVALHGRGGVIDAPAARGVQVDPRGSLDVRLDELAPGEKVLGVHVQVQVGRLSAAITETDADGFEPGGTDWIPAAAAPATDIVVPGVPSVARGREAKVRLDVVAPGEAAVVGLTVVTPDGSFTPQGLDIIEVPEQGVASVDLTEALQGDPAAIVLSADVPVTAGAQVVLRDPEIFGDSLYLAAAGPFDSPAVVPDNRSTKDLRTRVILSAPDAGATAVVTGFAAGREWNAGRVSLAAGDTKVLTVPAKKIGGKVVKTFGLVITPGGNGSLYGVRMLDEDGPRGPLVTSFPLSSARLLAEVPEAYPDVAVGSTE